MSFSADAITVAVTVQIFDVVPSCAVTVYVTGLEKFLDTEGVGLMVALAEIVRIEGITAVKDVPKGTLTAIVAAAELITALPV